VSERRPSSAPQGIARHGRLKKPRPGGALFGILGATVAVLLVAGGSVGAYAVSSILHNFNQGDPTAPRISTDVPVPPTVGAYPGGFNILIVGSDTRAGQNGIGGSTTQTSSTLNDVTMLLHVSADHTNATAVSFPRDMVVPIAACSHGGNVLSPINTSLYYGGSTDAAPGAGLPCVAKTVENLTGLPIQFAGLITFTGVIDVTNAIGGVPVCVNANIHDKETGLTLTKGTHKIKGMQALEFLRSRHGVGDGSDLARISSQQVYLSSLVRTIKSNGTLNNLGTVFKIASAASRHMELSQGFGSPVTLVAIAQALKDIPLDRVIFTQYPGTTGGTGVYAGKVQPLTATAAPLFALLKADKPFKLGTAAGNRGSVAGKAPTKTSTGTSTSTSTPSATSSPSSSTKGLPTVNNIIGQPSSAYTCSKAYVP
jgi:LCP family protein required for cell wall assembly